MTCFYPAFDKIIKNAIISPNQRRMRGLETRRFLLKSDRKERWKKNDTNRNRQIQSNAGSKQAELSAALRNRDDIAIEPTADPGDAVQKASDTEMAIRFLDRESSLLNVVRSALMRIYNGSFGVCLSCEGELKIKRLNAVPWAKYCTPCQEAVDRNEAGDDFKLVEQAS